MAIINFQSRRDAYPNDRKEFVHDRDDQKTFIEVFPDYETWKEKLNQFMIVKSVEDNNKAEAIYNQLAWRFKTNLFRYIEFATIYKHTSDILTRVYTIHDKLDAYKAGDVNKTIREVDNFKTNNKRYTDEENDNKYRVNAQTVKTTNTDAQIKAINQIAELTKNLQTEMDSFKKLFSNLRKEVELLANEVI